MTFWAWLLIFFIFVSDFISPLWRYHKLNCQGSSKLQKQAQLLLGKRLLDAETCSGLVWQAAGANSVSQGGSREDISHPQVLIWDKMGTNCSSHESHSHPKAWKGLWATWSSEKFHGREVGIKWFLKILSNANHSMILSNSILMSTFCYKSSSL